MQFVELRLYAPNGTDYTVLPNYTELSGDESWKDVGFLSFSYPLPDAVALGLTEGREIGLAPDGVEVSRYLVENTSENLAADSTQVRKVDGRQLLALFEDEVVYPSAWPGTLPDGHSFEEATAGFILRTLISRAKQRGGLAWLDETTFSGGATSDGNGWSRVISYTYATGTTLLQVIQHLQQMGMAEVKLVGHQLRAHNEGYFQQHRTPEQCTFRPGQSVKEQSVARDAKDFASHILIQGEEGALIEVTNPIAPTVLRRRVKFVSQGSIADSATLSIIGAASLERSNAIGVQDTIGIDVINPDAPQPWSNFRIGEWVWIEKEGALTEVQVKQISIGVDQAGVLSGGVTLGTLLEANDMKLQRKIDAITGGNSDNYGTLPNTGAADIVAPNAPTGITSSGGTYTFGDGMPMAQLTLKWTPPAFNADGTICTDVSNYYVEYAQDGYLAWTRLGPFSEPRAYVSEMNQDVLMVFRVYAEDGNGNVSVASADYKIRTEIDKTPPPPPNAPLPIPGIGQVFIKWNGTFVGGLPAPADFSHVEIHASQNPTFDPFFSIDAPDTDTLMATIIGPATTAVRTPYETPYYFILRAYDRSGNWADSVRVKGQSMKVAAEDISPSYTVGAGQVQFDARDLGAVNTFYGAVAPGPASTLLIGDIWVDAGNQNSLKRWDGTAWIKVDSQLIEQAVTASGQAAAAAAAAQNAANLAVNNATLALTTAQDARAASDGRVTSYFQGTAPTTAAEGDLWFDTAHGNRLSRWSAGTQSWVLAQDQSVGKAILDAADAKTIADSKIETYYQNTAPTGLAAKDEGDLWLDADGGNALWRWDGTKWVLMALGTQAVAFNARDLGSITTYFQASPPAVQLQPGDLWVDTDDANKLYRWDTNTWVISADTRIVSALQAAAGAQATADGKVKTFAQTAAPTGLTALDDGDLWVDTDDKNRLYRWSGPSLNWISIDDARISALIADQSKMQADIAEALAKANDAQAGADNTLNVFYQTSPPTGTSVNQGDLWIDTDDGNSLWRYSGTAWVLVDNAKMQSALTNSIAAKASADGKIRTFFQASAPTGMTAADDGDMWFDTDDGNRVYYWTGTAWAAVPFSAGAIAPDAITQDNLVSEVRAAVGQAFFADMKDVSRWQLLSGTGTFLSTPVTDALAGGFVGRATGGPTVWAHRSLIPVDPTQLYRVSVRIRRTSTTGTTALAGVIGVGADGSTLINANGSTGSTSNQFWVATSTATPGATWVNYVGYFKGAASTGTSTERPDMKNPGLLNSSVRYIRPAFTHSAAATTADGGDDIFDYDTFKVEVVPTGLVERANIQVAAINAALIEDASIINAKIADAAITNAKIGLAAITGAQIQTATITDANIQSLAASKITSDYLYSTITVSGTIRTSESSSRVEITNAGITSYSANTVSFRMDSTGGTGTFRGAVYARTYYTAGFESGRGRFIEMGDVNGTENNDELRFWNNNTIASIRNPVGIPGAVRISIQGGGVFDFTTSGFRSGTVILAGDGSSTYPRIAQNSTNKVAIFNGLNQRGLYISGSADGAGHVLIASDTAAVKLLNSSNRVQIKGAGDESTNYGSLEVGDLIVRGTTTGVSASGGGNADYATNAGNANYATNAGNANYASSAGSANSAAQASSSTFTAWCFQAAGGPGYEYGRLNGQNLKVSGSLAYEDQIYRKGSAVTVTSSKRLKTEITPLDIDMYPVLENAAIHVWNWKKFDIDMHAGKPIDIVDEPSGKTSMGPLVEDLPPWMSPNEEDPNDAWTYDEGNFIAGLWMAARQMVGDIKALQAEVADLKSRTSPETTTEEN